jgi:hypothetical protein
VRAVEILQGEPELLEIVGALRPASRLAYLLHGRQEQGNQRADDGDDDKELDQGKPV